jgi:hypothetical protein
VHVTHQLTNLLQTLPQQVEAAQRNYYGFQQPNKMSLETYYERFNENVKLMKEIKITSITSEAQAARFLSGLNRTIFQELHHQLNNLQHFKMDYPDNLAAAYNLAVNYIPSSQHMAASSERNVYHTSSRPLLKKK